MVKIALKDIVDDILLIVRNNNISESEDLSRAQIAIWVKGWRNKIWRDRLDRLKERALTSNMEWEDLVDDMLIEQKETGPMELEEVPSGDGSESNTKRTKEKLENVFNNHERSILAIHDESGENIQYMNHIRRHYQYRRKYTYGDMTAYYKDDGHIYVQGTIDLGMLKYIYVLALHEIDEDGEDDDDNTDDENGIKIPAWMVPMIKDAIMKSELAFMLNRPSDDSNNSTLASVKPHGPQDDEE